MYSIKGTKDIEFNYNISSIRKTSDTEYQYHGKPNNPNLVLSSGIKRIYYVAERIEIKRGNPSELIIHHYATSNFPKKAIVICPLVVSNGNLSEIDRLLGMEINETLDLNIGSEITDFTMELNESQNTVYTIRLSSGLPIRNSIDKPSIIEGNCSLNDSDRNALKTATAHAEIRGNPHNHTISPGEFNMLLQGYMNTNSRCTLNGVGYVRDGTSDPVVKDVSGKITGARVFADADNAIELTTDECTGIDGTKTSITPNGAGGSNGLNSNANPEMECFPTEGNGVFNLKFHIIYDNLVNEKFIAADGVGILEPRSDKDNDKTLRDAINAEVKNLKEQIEKLGGIYIKDATIPTNFGKVNETKYKYIIDSKDVNIEDQAATFFDKNKDTDVDIFISYIANADEKLRKFDSIADGKIVGSSALTKPHQVSECIFVAVKKGDDKSLLMNAKKFSEDYLNKDFNRYTHISIPGYMTNTENQSMKAIAFLVLMPFTGLITYYTIPEFYKIAVRKITRDSRECGNGDYRNYYMVTAFNYFFTILTILIPSIIMLTTNTNGILWLLITFGLICLSAMTARFKLDKMFFYRFYPKSGLSPCYETKDFKDTQGYGGRFKTLTYIPSALSALLFR